MPVKRLFFFFADRHDQDWLNGIDSNVEFGVGKRMRVKCGRFDPKYMITAPAYIGDVVSIECFPSLFRACTEGE